MQLKDEGDIYKLNHNLKFQYYFHNNHLINTFASINVKSQSERNTILATIEKEIENFKFKWIYNGLKWLIFFHQLLYQVKDPSIITTIQSLLFQIQTPKTWNKYQQYLLKKMFNPYLQYLLKFSAIKQLTLKQQPNQQSNDVYLQYNLIKYAIASFTNPIHQFTNFFKKYYPRLITSFVLIKKDILEIYNKIKLNYQQHKLQPINFFQVQQLSSSTLLIQHPDKPHLEKTIDTKASNCKTKQSPLLSKEIVPFEDLYGTLSGLNS